MQLASDVDDNLAIAVLGDAAVICQWTISCRDASVRSYCSPNCRRTLSIRSATDRVDADGSSRRERIRRRTSEQATAAKDSPTCSATLPLSEDDQKVRSVTNKLGDVPADVPQAVAQPPSPGGMRELTDALDTVANAAASRSTFTGSTEAPGRCGGTSRRGAVVPQRDVAVRM